MTLIGSARVSTSAQNPNLQDDALRQAGCLKIFLDKISGASKEMGIFGPSKFLGKLSIKKEGKASTPLPLPFSISKLRPQYKNGHQRPLGVNGL